MENPHETLIEKCVLVGFLFVLASVAGCIFSPSLYYLGVKEIESQFVVVFAPVFRW
jgi:hypothetical protein